MLLLAQIWAKVLNDYEGVAHTTAWSIALT
jgi:hypothetical protein